MFSWRTQKSENQYNWWDPQTLSWSFLKFFDVYPFAVESQYRDGQQVLPHRRPQLPPFLGRAHRHRRHRQQLLRGRNAHRRGRAGLLTLCRLNLLTRGDRKRRFPLGGGRPLLFGAERSPHEKTAKGGAEKRRDDGEEWPLVSHRQACRNFRNTKWPPWTSRLFPRRVEFN